MPPASISPDAGSRLPGRSDRRSRLSFAAARTKDETRRRSSPTARGDGDRARGRAGERDEDDAVERHAPRERRGSGDHGVAERDARRRLEVRPGAVGAQPRRRPVAGASEVQFLGHRDEVAQLAKLHRRVLPDPVSGRERP
ncbi:MAG: hypothetical protein AVDCRST_MAG13-3553 [uncultured Solirubrobacteraceae bacterium]|uniref:Uncharacterized protein n=1 Tax=uncultured Solirubrobacteraceae bacterium TaxID=1162706 RepID=A0A6J4THI1_9ACTN|nr:MAG: hypothetical protein AVDCRST_MAG13-3553 [uncultured Solirubrobacteraceae bacterium]